MVGIERGLLWCWRVEECYGGWWRVKECGGGGVEMKVEEREDCKERDWNGGVGVLNESRGLIKWIGVI